MALCLPYFKIKKHNNKRYDDSKYDSKLQKDPYSFDELKKPREQDQDSKDELIKIQNSRSRMSFTFVMNNVKGRRSDSYSTTRSRRALKAPLHEAQKDKSQQFQKQQYWQQQESDELGGGHDLKNIEGENIIPECLIQNDQEKDEKELPESQSGDSKHKYHIDSEPPGGFIQPPSEFMQPSTQFLEQHLFKLRSVSDSVRSDPKSEQSLLNKLKKESPDQHVMRCKGNISILKALDISHNNSNINTDDINNNNESNIYNNESNNYNNESNNYNNESNNCNTESNEGNNDNSGNKYNCNNNDNDSFNDNDHEKDKEIENCNKSSAQNTNNAINNSNNYNNNNNINNNEDTTDFFINKRPTTQDNNDNIVINNKSYNNQDNNSSDQDNAYNNETENYKSNAKQTKIVLRPFPKSPPKPNYTTSNDAHSKSEKLETNQYLNRWITQHMQEQKSNLENTQTQGLLIRQIVQHQRRLEEIKQTNRQLMGRSRQDSHMSYSVNSFDNQSITAQTQVAKRTQIMPVRSAIHNILNTIEIELELQPEEHFNDLLQPEGQQRILTGPKSLSNNQTSLKVHKDDTQNKKKQGEMRPGGFSNYQKRYASRNSFTRKSRGLVTEYQYETSSLVKSQQDKANLEGKRHMVRSDQVGNNLYSQFYEEACANATSTQENANQDLSYDNKHSPRIRKQTSSGATSINDDVYKSISFESLTRDKLESHREDTDRKVMGKESRGESPSFKIKPLSRYNSPQIKQEQFTTYSNSLSKSLQYQVQ